MKYFNKTETKQKQRPTYRSIFFTLCIKNLGFLYKRSDCLTPLSPLSPPSASFGIALRDHYFMLFSFLCLEED